MKNTKLSIFLLLGILVSCSKPEEEEPTSQLEVFEFKTNTPLASVQINFLRCSYFDIQFGCQGSEIFATGYTDDRGRYAVEQSVLKRAHEGIKLHKSNYWDEDGHTGVNYMAPEAWIILHLIRQNVYSFPRLFFEYDIDGESGNARINPFTVPFDTIVRVRAFGNEINKLNWKIGVGTGPVFTGGFNTFTITTILANGIVTQNPGRFGTDSVTVVY